jgi:RNA polymerase-binding transcription factor DksA
MPRATSAASSSSPTKRATAAKPSAAPAKKSTPAKKPATVAAASKKPAAVKKTTTKAPSKATSSTVTTAKPAAKKSAPAKKAPAKAAAKKAPAAVAAKPAATKSAAKPAAPAKKKLSATELKFIESQHELLLKERATYLRQADSLKAEADSLAELREPGDVQFDEESGEGDTLAVERERDLALSHQARAAVEEIDHALTKIELGTYGICEVSGQPIPKERLKAIPWARERVEYKVGGFGRR